MVNIALGIDDIYGYRQDIALLNECASILEKAGHTVHKCGVGPSVTPAYVKSHTVDWMVQIAGGMCIGANCDYVYGIKQGYYHAKKCCVPVMYKHFTTLDPYTYVPDKGAWDDNFSKNIPYSFFSQFLNQTFPETYKKFSQYFLPFSAGKTAQEMMSKMLGGQSSESNTTSTGGGGTTALDLIKQVVSDWDEYGVRIGLEGGKVIIGRATTRPVYDKESYHVNAPIIREDVVINDTLTFTDWNPSTTNYVYNNKTAMGHEELVKRFGKRDKQVPNNTSKSSSDETWITDMMNVAQRDSGRVVELSILPDPCVYCNSYVYLSLGSVGLYGFYYVQRLSLSDEHTMQLTLERAPPSRYQEKTQTTSVETDQNSNGGDMISIGNNLAAKYGFCAKLARDKGAKGYVTSNYADMKKSGCGDCHAWSDALYTELNAVGIKTRIIQYNNGYVGNHRSVQVYQNGEWVDYPYKQTNISKLASAQSYKGGMFVWRNAP